jgi:hypothetical protein
MNPWHHSKIHAKKFGGVPEDYLELNNFMDSSGYSHADIRHRAALHHNFGIYICEQVFGQTIKNSDGKDVPVKDIATRHIIEDLGFVPNMSQYLNNMEMQDWMSGTFKRRTKNKSVSINFKD